MRKLRTAYTPLDESSFSTAFPNSAKVYVEGPGGVRVPFRFAAYRKDRIGVLFHIDPGIKFYTTNPAAFGFQWPIGVTLGYTVGPELTIAFGVDLPMFLRLTPSPVDFYLGPLFGPAFEYHVDRELTIGLNTRFGPMIETAGGNTRFGFVTQLLLAYRL